MMDQVCRQGPDLYRFNYTQKILVAQTRTKTNYLPPIPTRRDVCIEQVKYTLF